MQKIRGIVALLGRPNVGKSTIVNCLTQTNVALIDDRPGVTRDRIYGRVEAELPEQPGFVLVDTGGFEEGKGEHQPFSDNLVWRQTMAALEESDLVVVILDARDGLHPLDEHLVNLLRKMNKNFIVLVNKTDGTDKAVVMGDFFALGVDSLLSASAAHRHGIVELRETIFQKLDADVALNSSNSTDPDAINVAIIGRPNVGKSSILNRLIGGERSVVSSIPGTTRDPVDVQITYDNQSYVIVDTAGIRRRGKVDDKLDVISMMRSIRALERADVIVLVIDASEGLTDQDARLASMASASFKPILIAVNKWDLVAEKTSKTADQFAEDIRDDLRTVAFAPIMFVSCLENQRVHKILAQVQLLWQRSRHKVETSRLNKTLEQIVRDHTPALIRNHSKRVKFFYATQVKVGPPTFLVFCNVANEIQESYKRYMTNRFRSDLGFDAVPLQLVFRGKSEGRGTQHQ